MFTYYSLFYFNRISKINKIITFQIFFIYIQNLKILTYILITKIFLLNYLIKIVKNFHSLDKLKFHSLLIT